MKHVEVKSCLELIFWYNTEKWGLYKHDVHTDHRILI